MGQYGIDDLKLAFSLHVVDQIVAADDQLTKAELAFLDARFPQSVLHERGFVDEDGVRTEAYHDAAMDALERLPVELDKASKLELLSMFFAATVADAQFELAEGGVLVDAARLLDLSDDDIDGFLEGRAEAGATRVANLDASEE
ncbi:MAG: hypothetical protein H6737_28985 [Alphaproteobacteria bacterium]|nr:hypothetical protein [Alphaproteobacteria bacterium]